MFRFWLQAYNERGLSAIALARMRYTMIFEGKVTININLTANADIPKYSAIPPQTPAIALSVADFLNLFLTISLHPSS